MTPLEAATDLAQRGFRIFPVGANKIPLAGSRGCLDATTDETVICGWFTDAPGRFPAVATGQGLVVIDLDVKNGHDGIASLAAIAGGA